MLTAEKLKYNDTIYVKSLNCNAKKPARLCNMFCGLYLCNMFLRSKTGVRKEAEQ